MASARKTLYGQLIAVLLRIRRADGYHNDITQVRKRLETIDEGGAAAYPRLFCLIGASAFDDFDETGDEQLQRIGFGVYAYVQADDDPKGEGKLTDAAEDMIEDIMEAIAADTSMTVGATALALDVKVTFVEPYLDFENNIAEIGITVTVRLAHGADV